MDIQATLDQAILAAKAGRRADARRLLESVLEADQRNEQAWLWLSGVVDDEEERVICLENVLIINRHNQAARKGLAALGVAPSGEQPVGVGPPPAAGQPVAVGPPPAEQFQVAATAPAEDVGAELPATTDKRVFIVITIVLVILLLCTVMSILAFVLVR
jgi:hypothetical protein